VSPGVGRWPYASRQVVQVPGSIAPTLSEHNRRLAFACDVANQDPDLRALEYEFDALTDGIAEPWVHTPANGPGEVSKPESRKDSAIIHTLETE
jgi:hypothetical protein